MMFDTDQPTSESCPDLVAAMARARVTKGQTLRDLAARGKFKGDVELSAHLDWCAIHGTVRVDCEHIGYADLDF